MVDDSESRGNDMRWKMSITVIKKLSDVGEILLCLLKLCSIRMNHTLSCRIDERFEMTNRYWVYRSRSVHTPSARVGEDNPDPFRVDIAIRFCSHASIVHAIQNGFNIFQVSHGSDVVCE